MKNLFAEFYRYSEDEIREIWNNCLFVFDTNVLLNLYRYSKDTSDEFLKILDEIHKKGQIWMPYQVGLEFNEHRIQIIFDFDKSYDDIKDIVSSEFNDAKKKIKNQYNGNHPSIDLKKIDNEIDECLKKIKSMIDDDKNNHPDRINKDEILEKLTLIFEKNVGSPYSKEKISEIMKKGQDRYSKNIPPGYKDGKKEGERQYGDLILWFQIIDKAKASKKPIIFVTQDKKEDWWWIQSGKTIGPRYELKHEMREGADVKFHMYSSEQFLEYASKHFGEEVKSTSITEVGRIGTMLDEHNNIMLVPEYPSTTYYSHELLSKLDDLFGKPLANPTFEDNVYFELDEYYNRLVKCTKSIVFDMKVSIKQIEELIMIQEAFRRKIFVFFEKGSLRKDQLFILANLLRSSVELCIEIVESKNNDLLLELYLRMTRSLIADLELFFGNNGGGLSFS